MTWSAAAAAARRATRGAYGEVREGRTITFRPSSGPALADVDGVFRSASRGITVGATGAAEVSSFSPTLGSVELAQFAQPFPTPDDRIEIRGRVYAIEDALEDGQGGVSLLLTDKGPIP